ncbi:TonB-dependent receptor [Rapidithrix thailandica]|uniref:TonB-dependent receptor n=1 Tax=Rapidithrix thailandica TaxID=413964 RepID=A0AAW9RY34_9BACT
MALTRKIFLSILFVLCLPIISWGQGGMLDKSVSLPFKNASYTQVLDFIREQTQANLIYNNRHFSERKTLRFPKKELALRQVLELVCQDAGLEFQIEGNDILLKKKVPPVLYTISGKITDKESGEELIGASVFIEGANKGAVTDQYGFYSLTLPEGRYQLTVSYLGYKTQKSSLQLTENKLHSIELILDKVELQEVVVTSDKEEIDANVKSTQMGALELNQSTVQKMPALFGESDIIKAVQLLPGVSSSTEGASGLVVRGGSNDQNLILMDNTPIYSVSHVMNLFSVFNTDILKNAQLYKGSIPSKYGGRLSSVLDVQLKDGNTKKTTVSGGIGSVSSRLTLEVPLVKNKSSMLFSARRTYLDLLVRSMPNQPFVSNTLYFYDMNFKAHYKINNRDKLTVSGYLGRDQVGWQDLFGNSWGNTAASLQWTHVFNLKLISNLTLYSTNFNNHYSINLVEPLGYLQKYDVRDFGGKYDMSYYMSPNHRLDFGFEFIHHRYAQGNMVSTEDPINIKAKQLDPVYGLEMAGYVSWEQKVSPSLSLNYGFRLSRFEHVGKGKLFIYDKDEVVSPETNEDNITDTVFYAGGDRIHAYQGIEPRLSARWLWNDHLSLKVSFNRTIQYNHRLSTANTLTPTDMWTPVNKYIKPQEADLYAIGLFGNFMGNQLESSVELYYKKMRNLIDYKPFANQLLNDHLETEILSGEGKAYGVELLVKRKMGKITGWLSYTFSNSTRQINGINNNQSYPSSFDRKHDFTSLFSFNLSKWLVFSANWVYASGVAYTFPVGKYVKDGFIVPYYTERNKYRLPPTHRLDMSVTFYRRMTPEKKNESSFSFSVYNAYAQKNPYAYVFRQKAGNPNETEAVQLYLFTVVPSFTYNFKF